MSVDGVAAALAEGREWLDAFAFADVANRGQARHTIGGLTPGRQYAFIVASASRRFGAGSWSEWAYLTPAGTAAACPADGGGEFPPTPAPPPAPTATPAPMPTPSPTLTPTPTPQPTPIGTGAGAGDYDYDADQDGLIEVASLAQLAAIRADLNGDGVSPAPAYAAAFPYAMPGMGCPEAGCTGYELVADLDFDTNGNGEADAGDAYWNDGAGWVPIGDAAHKFTADFDGNNYTIANLYINQSSLFFVGLFGNARGSSIVQVGLASATVHGYRHVGGLVGYSYGSVINASYATGSVSGDVSVGGLVGGTDGGTIKSSYTTANVSGRESVGGLSGQNGSNTIINASYAKGSVSGNNSVGGLVGSNNVSSFFIGGYGGIISSYATGSVSGGNNVGGLVGYNRSGTISASYATGSVAGDGDDIGGLVGRSTGGSITTSYAVGRVSTSGDTFYVGGLVGYQEGGDITASYWDTETTGQVGSYGGVGKTTAELQSPAGYTGIYAEWNLDLDDDGNSDDPWDFGDAGQYPVLKYGGLDAAGQRE